ncbi:MAG: ATP-binding cassette domain-containing protein [Rikenellaceae bacterium]
MIITAQSVCKTYRENVALRNLSLEVKRGSIYGLLGPNGAGKSTFIKILNRITMPDSGEILFNGEKLSREHIYKIGYLPEERGLYKKMKVGEQVMFFAKLKGLSQAEAMQKIKPWFERMQISSWWDKKIEELSKGMAQKIQFIITVIHKPELLILDEPFSGFDPINAELIKNEILSLRDRGTTVILSTHNMNSVEQLCDNITLINKAENILSGEINEIRRKYSSGEIEVLFSGSSELLREQLLPISTIVKMSENRAVIVPNPTIEKRELISCVNQTVEINRIEDRVSTMNDIFLTMVKGEKSNSNLEFRNSLTE